MKLLNSILITACLYGCGTKLPDDPPPRPLVYIGRGDLLLVLSGDHKYTLVTVLDHDDTDMTFQVEPKCLKLKIEAKVPNKDEYIELEYEVLINCSNETFSLSRKEVQLLRRS